MEYIKQEDLKDFHFLQVPRVIWKAKIKGQLNDLAFMIYVELFDRLKVSAINNWIDKDGNVYIKYSYEELMKILELKSKGSITKGIKCLLQYDLIKQKKGFNTSSIFYLTNILKLTEVHEREHSSTQTQTQKYTNVVANYNNCNYNKSINNNISYMTIDNGQRERDYFNGKSAFDDYLNLYNMKTEIFETLGYFYDLYLIYNNNYNHYMIDTIETNYYINRLTEMFEHIDSNYTQLQAEETMFDYTKWYFETNERHNISNYANIKTFGLYMVREHLGIIDKELYFEKDTGDFKDCLG